jgi:hypothetical protein
MSPDTVKEVVAKEVKVEEESKTIDQDGEAVKVSDVFLNLDMKQPSYIQPVKEKKESVDQDDDDFERDENDTDGF